MAIDKNPDIILITESWCNPDIDNAFLSIDGYELQTELRIDRGDTKRGRGGGLLTYVKSGLQVMKMDLECQYVQCSKFKIRDIVVYLLYRSPNAQPEAMAELTHLVKNAEKSSIIFGDFNLPEINWESGTTAARSREFLAATEDALMEQLVPFSTQVRGNTLDLVLSNIPERIMEVREEGRLGSSDHDMIGVKIACGPAKDKVKVALNWRRADWNGIRAGMDRVNWKRELKGTADNMWRAFKTKVLREVDKNVPSMKVRGGGRPAWIDKNLLAEIKQKKRLWNEHKGGPIPDEYKKMDNRLKKRIRKAKRKFEKDLSDGKNKRRFFKYVKKKTKTRESVGPLKDSAGRTVTGDKEVADELNRFFSSVFTVEDDEHIPTAETLETPILENLKISEWEIKKKIRKLKKDAAAGPDGIGPRLLQEIENSAASALCIIFRRSVTHGEVPEDWKRAHVTPIFKKGKKTEAGNYRPVSLTSVCCKVLESMMKDEIMKHLMAGKLLKRSQHGFMPGRSCTTNLLETLEFVTKAVDNGEPVDIIYLDFAKAFDKVPKHRLMEKLRAHGIGGHIHKWIYEWLTDRRQRVVLNGKESEWVAVLSGVPQGSVLGPLLFLIYINDLDSAAATVDLIKKFADDTKVGQKVGSEEKRMDLQQSLDKLCEWSDVWQMEFNIKKCKAVHFGHNNPLHQYTMKGVPLEAANEERDIGVTMTTNLKPSAQCAKAARTAQAVLGQLTRAFHYRDRHVFMRLFYQYVRPHLEFAVAAWSPWTAADKECLEKVQRRAVMMVTGLVGQTYEERLIEMNMVTLEERRHQMDMLEMYKILTGKDDVERDVLFSMAADQERATRATADQLNVLIPAARLEVRKQFFTQRVPKLWNAVPATLKQSATAASFRHGYMNLRARRDLNNGIR